MFNSKILERCWKPVSCLVQGQIRNGLQGLNHPLHQWFWDLGKKIGLRQM